MTLNEIGQIAIPVTDLRRAVDFYRDRLGMRFLFEAPPSLAFFDCGGIRLMLQGSQDSDQQPDGEKAGIERFSPLLYYKVPDLNAAFQELSGHGVAFEHEPHLIARLPDHDLWMAFFRDPDKNLLGLMCEIREIRK